MPERRRRVERLATYIERRSSPRATMLAVVSASALCGFLLSALLLWLGLTHMPTRYALTCAAGYAVFLSLMNRWLRRWVPHNDESSLVEAAVDSIDLASPWLRPGGRPSMPGGGSWLEGGRSGGGGASASFASTSVPPPVMVAPTTGGSSSSSWTDIDLDGDSVKLLPLIAVAALVVGLVAVLSVIWQAPRMLAEVLVDAALAGSIYGRLRAMKTDWTFGVVRRTWLPMLVITITMVGLAVAGQMLKPGADSIGDFFR